MTTFSWWRTTQWLTLKPSRTASSKGTCRTTSVSSSKFSSPHKMNSNSSSMLHWFITDDWVSHRWERISRGLASKRSQRVRMLTLIRRIECFHLCAKTRGRSITTSMRNTLIRLLMSLISENLYRVFSIRLKTIHMPQQFTPAGSSGRVPGCETHLKQALKLKVTMTEVGSTPKDRCNLHLFPSREN